MKRKWSWLFATTSLVLLALSTPSTAQKNKAPQDLTEEQKAEIRDKRMKKLILANELAVEGRETGSPESLLAAASILRSLSGIGEMNKAAISEVKPEIKGEGKAELDMEVKPQTLQEQSDQLFKDARDIAVELNAKQEIEKLIDIIQKREILEERAVVGGPKQMARKIGGGHYHTFHFKLYNNQLTHFVYHSSIPLRVSVARSDNDNAWFLGITMNASHTFHPEFHPKQKIAPVTVIIHNPTNQAANYQFVLQ